MKDANRNDSLRSIVLASACSVLLCVGAGAAPITGGTTTVTLNAATFTTLTTTLGFTIAPIAPATVSTNPLQAVFPITGGDTTTVIDHSGGLSFTKSGTTANISDFIIDPAAGLLTGILSAGGNSETGVRFFDLSSGNLLTVDPTLATALSAAFGVPNLSGAPVGTAAISLSPEPASIGLAGLGLLASAFLMRKRKPRG